MPLTKSAIRTKLKKLTKTAEEAEETMRSINITRLTSIKSLCQDHDAASHFAMFVAHRTLQKMEERERPEFQDAEQWEMFKTLAGEAFKEMEAFMNAPSIEETRLTLSDTLSKVYRSQNTYTKVKHYNLRTIHCNELLTIEHALKCLLYQKGYAHWAYALARGYVERYNSKQGTGICRESAPMIWEIVQFWENYYLKEQ